MVVSKTVAQGEFASVLRDVLRVGVGMSASVHGLCPADLPARYWFVWEGAFLPRKWHLDALTVEGCSLPGSGAVLGCPKHFIPWSASPGGALGEPAGLDEGLCCCGCCFW